MKGFVRQCDPQFLLNKSRLTIFFLKFRLINFIAGFVVHDRVDGNGRLSE